MTRQKAFKFLVVLLLSAAIAVSSAGCGRFFAKRPVSFSELIKKGDISDLTLTIYYVSPYILYRAPLSVEDLMGTSRDDRIVVNGHNLEEYANLLNQLSDAWVVPVEEQTYLDVRLYYVFENRREGKMFDVATRGEGSGVFVNGIEVQSNDIFYDVIMPFLPEEVAKEWTLFLEYGFAGLQYL